VVVERARVSRGESRAALARALGVSPQAVSHKLDGVRPWSLDEVDRLADHYAMPPAAFLIAPPASPAVTLRAVPTPPESETSATGSYRTLNRVNLLAQAA